MKQLALHAKTWNRSIGRERFPGADTQGARALLYLDGVHNSVFHVQVKDGTQSLEAESIEIVLRKFTGFP